MASLIHSGVLTFFLFAFGKAHQESSKSRRPNIVLMVADDLGYGDVGCFGNDTLSTPNVDRLADKGARLTHVLAASSLCTPSRAALLTGRYPVRSGMAPAEYTVNVFTASRSGLPSDETTFAKVLQTSGYATAIIGKWHLGFHCDYYGDNCHHPSIHGFDHFYGLPIGLMEDWGTDHKAPLVVERFIPHIFKMLAAIAAIGLATNLWLYYQRFRCSGTIIFFLGFALPVVLYVLFSNPQVLNGTLHRNDALVEQPVRVWTLARRFVHETKQFITKQHSIGRPFMVFVSFTHMHPVLTVHPDFEGRSSHGIYGDSVQEMDWMVGEIMDHLDNLELSNDTVVVFTSDHGAHLEVEPQGSNRPFSGGKFMHGMEGGIRVPTIVSWPGMINEGSVISTPSSLMDLYPTFLRMAGIDWTPVKPLDGRNLLPVLIGQTDVSPHQYLFHYSKYDSIDAVTYIENEQHVWKMHFKFPNWLPGMRQCNKRCVHWEIKNNSPPVLYNIIEDVSESNPLKPTDNKYQEVLKNVRQALEQHKLSLEPAVIQLTMANLMWRPWLQPCCNFPLCSCQENITHILA